MGSFSSKAKFRRFKDSSSKAEFRHFGDSFSKDKSPDFEDSSSKVIFRRSKDSSSKAESRHFVDSDRKAKSRLILDSYNKDKCLLKKVAFYRWEINDPKREWEKHNFEEKPTMFSKSFLLDSQPLIKFALYIDTQLNPRNKKSFGVVVQNIDKSHQVKVSAKIWIENACGDKKLNDLVQEHVFNSANNRCGFDGFNNETFYRIFVHSWGNGFDLSICCELTELDLLPCDMLKSDLKSSSIISDLSTSDLKSSSISCGLSTSDLKSLLEFNQQQWTSFENNVYDAVIKVEDVEFKVLKSFFITQSDVFKSMFKERNIGRVEIKDISKEAMQDLIKWVYTGQISVDSEIEDLFLIADKYNIKLLKTTCVESMLLTIDNKNVFPRLVLAFAHNSDQLTEASLKFAAGLSGNYWVNFKRSSDWIEFARKKPKIAYKIANLVQEKMIS